jgi:hypothetical protein
MLGRIAEQDGERRDVLGLGDLERRDRRLEVGDERRLLGDVEVGRRAGRLAQLDQLEDVARRLDVLAGVGV